MKRLPSYDSRTRRSEMVVFCTIGLAAGALIALAALDGMRLAGSLDSVAALWTDGPAVAQDGAQRLNQSLTNVSFRKTTLPGSPSPMRAGPALPAPHFPQDSATEFE